MNIGLDEDFGAPNICTRSLSLLRGVEVRRDVVSCCAVCSYVCLLWPTVSVVTLTLICRPTSAIVSVVADNVFSFTLIEVELAHDVIMNILLIV